MKTPYYWKAEEPTLLDLFREDPWGAEFKEALNSDTAIIVHRKVVKGAGPSSSTVLGGPGSDGVEVWDPVGVFPDTSWGLQEAQDLIEGLPPTAKFIVVQVKHMPVKMKIEFGK